MGTQSLQHVTIGKQGYVGTITIDRPEKLNALNTAVMASLEVAFDEFSADPEVRAVILTGGERNFAAGADVEMLQELKSASDAYTSIMTGAKLYDKIDAFPKPTVAAISGFALGGGCELALACDIRVASETAKLGFPEINLGILPGGGGTQRLIRLIGVSSAKSLLLMGEPVAAERAFSLGLVHQVVPPAELSNAAQTWAQKLAAKAPFAMQLLKRCIFEGARGNMDQALMHERQAFILTLLSEDKEEGIKALLEKRKPYFSGR